MPPPKTVGLPEALGPYGPTFDDDPESVAGPHADLSGQLLNAVLAARWFGGKGRRAELTGHTRLPWLTEVDRWPAVRIEIVEVSYPPPEDPDPDTRADAVEGPEGALRQAQGTDVAAQGTDVAAQGTDSESQGAPVPHELYQLVTSYWPAPQPGLHHAELARLQDPEIGLAVAYDAAQDPAACRVLLELLLVGRSVRGADTEVRFHLSRGEGLNADLPASPFKGQQSNTSIMFGDVAMMKLFRRLELGRNLDIEVHDALNRAGVHDVAALYGWIEAGWRHRTVDVRADLAMVVEKFGAAEDGWALALAALAENRPFADHAGLLGHDLAEIHEAMRAAFPTERHSGATTAALMTERFHAARRVAPALDAYTDGVLERFRDLAHTDLDLQRVHGDFHLGQTLHTPDAWKIIDFEGEPVKTLTERSRPDSVWRDIAGMLRSFDYAGAHHPGPLSAAWVADCRQAFLDAYAGGALDPADAVILRAYEMDKAVYEVVYEVRNRPDWVHIPLGAVAALAAPDAANTAPTATHDPGPDEA